jgi:hypothetical protein
VTGTATAAVASVTVAATAAESRKEGKKRQRTEEAAHMQSLSSFMRFAEEEKRQQDDEQRRREQQQAGGTGEGDEPASGPAAKPSQAKRPKVIGPAMPAPAGDGDSNYVPQSTTSGANKPRQGPARGPTLEGGEAVWVPPTNQSGDGRTALNAKLGY